MIGPLGSTPPSTWPTKSILLYALCLLASAGVAARAAQVIGGGLWRWWRRIVSLREPPTRWVGYVLTVDPLGWPTMLLYGEPSVDGPPVWAQPLAVSPVAEGIPVTGIAAVYGDLPGAEAPDRSQVSIVLAVNGQILWPLRVAWRVGRADLPALIIG